MSRLMTLNFLGFLRRRSACRWSMLAPGLAAAAVLVTTACGGSGPPTANPSASLTSNPTATSTSTQLADTMRHGSIRPVHMTTGGERRFTLQAVLDDGQVVMTAIGSDADDPPGTDEPELTSMRQALLFQLRTALTSLGWKETTTGPDWYDVEFVGGPDAVIPVIESTSPVTEGPTDGEETSDADTAEPAPPPQPNELGDLVSLIGKDFDDPAVARLARVCGPGSDFHRSGNIACENAGFELTLGGARLVVKAITLFNFEYSGSNQYGGTLPLGLTWDDDYAAVLDKLGDPIDRLGGGGVEVQLRYQSGDAYVLVSTTATHDNPDYLANAKLHWIEISMDPVSGLPPG